MMSEQIRQYMMDKAMRDMIDEQDAKFMAFINAELGEPHMPQDSFPVEFNTKAPFGNCVQEDKKDDMIYVADEDLTDLGEYRKDLMEMGCDLYMLREAASHEDGIDRTMFRNA